MPFKKFSHKIQVVKFIGIKVLMIFPSYAFNVRRDCNGVPSSIFFVNCVFVLKFFPEEPALGFIAFVLHFFFS